MCTQRLKKVFPGIFLMFCLAVFGLSLSAQRAKPDERYSPLRSGNPDAIAKIEVYYDLQCTACAKFHSILKAVENEFGDKVVINFRHFPLRIPAHDKAFLAARAVEAARVQGKGRKMLDLILANQKHWTANKRTKYIFFSYAKRLGLNMKHFREDIGSEELLHRIVDDIVEANLRKLNSTPTVFLNGKQLGFAEAQEIEAEIKEIVK